MGGSNAVSNLVRLTPEEHFIAHQLLVKIYPDNHKLKFALQAMLMDTGNQQRKNKAYGWVRKLVSENMKENNPNAGGKARLEYIAKHGRAPIPSKYEWSKEGREQMVQSKNGINNPNFRCKPWNHPRQTDITRSIWHQADQLFDWWKETNGSYLRMSKAFGYDQYSGFTHIISYFKNGWIPREDQEWIVWTGKK